MVDLHPSTYNKFWKTSTAAGWGLQSEVPLRQTLQSNLERLRAALQRSLHAALKDDEGLDLLHHLPKRLLKFLPPEFDVLDSLLWRTHWLYTAVKSVTHIYVIQNIWFSTFLRALVTIQHWTPVTSIVPGTFLKISSFEGVLYRFWMTRGWISFWGEYSFWLLRCYYPENQRFCPIMRNRSNSKKSDFLFTSLALQ